MQRTRAKLEAAGESVHSAFVLHALPLAVLLGGTLWSIPYGPSASFESPQAEQSITSKTVRRALVHKRKVVTLIMNNTNVLHKLPQAVFIACVEHVQREPIVMKHNKLLFIPEPSRPQIVAVGL